jgi:uncharacterized paraquat-inducible protein A
MIRKVFSYTEALGKWSMTDVFVLAVLVVVFKVDSVNYQLKALSGIYIFATSSLLSILANHQAKKYLTLNKII